MRKIIILLLCGLTGGLLSYEKPVLELESHQFEADNGKKVQAEMGRFKVKERRANPRARDLELAFIRFGATGPEPGSPIVYLAGGPGGSGTRTARGARFELFMRMREAGDVIAFDQRGTGLSTRLERCEQEWSLPLDKPLDRQSLIAQKEENARACAAFWREQGVDLNGYNTLESAHDLDDLRRALGVEKISLWGISYGTHLALAYAKTYPQHTDKLLLAGLEGLDHTIKRPIDTQILLEKIDAMAASEGFTFLEDMKTVSSRLEQKPVSIDVITDKGDKKRMTIGKFDLQLATSAYLSGPRNFKVLPTYYRQMKAGDFSGLATTMYDMRSGGTRGMSTAMDSASFATPQRLAMIREQEKTTLLGGAINFLPYVRLAGALGIRDLGDDFRASFESAAPALFISGTLDGRTVVNNAVELLTGFSNGHHLIIEGAGHSNPLFLSSPEIAEIMLRFMKGKPDGDRRISLPQMNFRIREAIEMNPQQLASYAGNYSLDNGGSMSLQIGENHLVADVTGMGVFNFFPSSATEFFMKDAPVVMTFSRKDGTVTGAAINYEGVVIKASLNNSGNL